MRIPTSKQDKGFTLIELLVVVVIIGILAAVAIPIFLNQREKAVDAGIKSDLKSLATAQESYFVDAKAYTTTAQTLTDNGFKKTAGNLIEVVVTGGTFCLKGTNPDGTGTAWYYDSDGGGLSTTACAANGFTAV